MPDLTKETVNRAMEKASRRYFAECRRRIPGFIDRHFRYPGAWHTNKKAWGWDLLRAPFNLFWAPIYALLMILAWCFGKLGITPLSRWMAAAPSGLSTSVQKHISVLVYRDLLKRDGNDDRLEDYILAALEPLSGPGADHRQLTGKLEPVVHDALEQYTITRTASADITNSLLSTILGAFAFKKFTPGGLAVGFTLAAYVAQWWAVKDFWAGEFFGSIYYNLFPPTPGWDITLLSTLFVVVILAMFASFSGLLTDPIQSWTGIHKRRLNKMINHLEKDFLRQHGGSFRPKDQYIARILEIIDAAKSQL